MTQEKRPAVVALGAGSEALANRIATTIGGEVHMRRADGLASIEQSGDGFLSFSDTISHLQALFQDERPIIGLCAAGILVRALAPDLSDKRHEPPVLAVGDNGDSIVPLLGGHHGANDLARIIATTLGGHAAITTAGDLRFGVALDAPPNGWTLGNPDEAKSVMATLIKGAEAEVRGDEALWLEQSRLPLSDKGEIAFQIGVERQPALDDTLIYHPHRLALGVGCERGCEPAELDQLVSETLERAGLASEAIAVVVSADIKTDEVAIHYLADKLGRPARFFKPEVLEGETPRLANPSEIVYREVGSHGVSEAAALAAAGPEATLIVQKTKSARATCALALSPGIIDPFQVGRGRGRLAIVGIGPGSAEWLTPEARTLLEQSDAFVGYGLYLDLIKPLIGNRECFQSGLGHEEDRVMEALRLAAAGRNVALISSGDAGIFALATLAFEALGGDSAPDGAQRAEIIVAPGLTAMQAAAARAGAPLGHDFCAISLSDLMTPWEVIEKRIEAAAHGDFVIAFYNPVSQRRQTQLAAAKAILLEKRPGDAPVVLARNLGREGEDVRFVDLADLSVDDVDMLTIVLVGASSTQRVHAGGREWLYTPRGYSLTQDPPNEHSADQICSTAPRQQQVATP